LPEMRDLAHRIIPIAAECARMKAHKPPLYAVQIASEELCQALQTERRWIVSQLEQFPLTEPSPTALKDFLRRAHEIVDCVRQLFKKRYILSALGLPHSHHSILDTPSCRIAMSVHRILDCGVNTLVLGPAGAGKTTTLQMYAKSKICDSQKLCIYIALPSLISLARDRSQPADTESADRLIEYVIQHLSSAGCCVARDEFVRLLKSGKVVLELDGIDEVIVKLPWLLSAVATFCGTYDATQVVLSSRLSGDFADDLPFTTVTLLPFSDVQRNVFIRNWFGNESPRETCNAEQIIAHLKKNREMGEIVRSPLLATVMCVLQEHGFPLPETEVLLYRDRLKLLLGRFDESKGVNRLKSHPEVLEDIAARVAFILHTRHLRHADKREIVEITQSQTWSDSTKKIYTLAVEELCHPCEVLVPMTDNEQIGFGHLRYQEHLAARYLSVYGSEELAVFGTDPWWRGVFVLLAKMSLNAEWLIKTLSEGGLGNSLDTIKAITSVYPPQERRRLMQLARSIEELDLVTDDNSTPYYPGSDDETTLEDLLREQGSIGGKMHNI